MVRRERRRRRRCMEVGPPCVERGVVEVLLFWVGFVVFEWSVVEEAGES